MGPFSESLATAISIYDKMNDATKDCMCWIKCRNPGYLYLYNNGYSAAGAQYALTYDTLLSPTCST